MPSENQQKLIESNKKIAISVQVISEDMHRTNLKDLKELENWLRLENVDEKCLGHFLKWAKGLIDDNLQSDMRFKKLMQTMIANQVDSLNNHDDGDNYVS